MTHTAPDVLHATYTAGTSTSPSRQSLRALAVTGFVAAATLLIGSIAIAFIPDQLNTQVLDKTMGEIAAHHRAEVVAGWMFAVCLASLIPFFWFVVRSLNEAARMPATIGACIITAGATVDIVGSLILVAVGHGMAVAALTDPAARAVGIALLHLGASLDAMYNLTLGTGLILIARSMRASGLWPRWLGTLALVVGVLSLPVALEWYSPAAAMVQLASGGLCLVWLSGMSVVALRRSGQP